eukprot:g46587.t1
MVCPFSANWTTSLRTSSPFAPCSTHSVYQPSCDLYLTLYAELLFESCIGERGHEEVIKALQAETVEYGCSLGVETAKYRAAVRWLQELLYELRFTSDRLRVTLKRLLNSVPGLKNDAGTVLNACKSLVCFQRAANYNHAAFLTQQVTRSLNQLRAALTHLPSLRVFVAADWLRQEQLARNDQPEPPGLCRPHRAIEVVLELAEGKATFTELGLDSAKSATSFGLVQNRHTIHSAASASMMDTLGEECMDNAKQVLQAIQKTTTADMVRVLNKYLLLLFSNEACVRPQTVFPSARDFFLAQGVPVEEEDDEEESEEEEEEESDECSEESSPSTCVLVVVVVWSSSPMGRASSSQSQRTRLWWWSDIGLASISMAGAVGLATMQAQEADKAATRQAVCKISAYS